MTTILSLQPKAQHIGYAVFEGAVLVDWGNKHLPGVAIEERTSRRAVPVVRTLIQVHEPQVLVLPEESRSHAILTNTLSHAIRNELTAHSIPVFSFSRRDIRSTFSSLLKVSKPNKGRIMEAIARWFPELSGSLPSPRRPWRSEDYHVPVFDAIANAVTWFDNHGE